MVKKMQRKFTAEFKEQVALAAIGNQMTITEIVEKFGVSKSLVYQWKNEFMEGVSKVFEGDRKVQQDAKQIDNFHLNGDGAGFCKAGIQSLGDRAARQRLINPKSRICVNRQMKILGVSKSVYYYTPRCAKADESAICAAIDREHLEHPVKVVIQMREFLVAMGITIGVKRIRSLMRQMAIEPFYPKPNHSKLGRAKYVHPYLLRGKPIYH